eukprot:Gb_12022 [translate_table: standard]
MQETESEEEIKLEDEDSSKEEGIGPEGGDNGNEGKDQQEESKGEPNPTISLVAITNILQPSTIRIIEVEGVCLRRTQHSMRKHGNEPKPYDYFLKDLLEVESVVLLAGNDTIDSHNNLLRGMPMSTFPHPIPAAMQVMPSTMASPEQMPGGKPILQSIIMKSKKQHVPGSGDGQRRFEETANESVSEGNKNKKCLSIKASLLPQSTEERPLESTMEAEVIIVGLPSELLEKMPSSVETLDNEHANALRKFCLAYHDIRATGGKGIIEKYNYQLCEALHKVAMLQSMVDEISVHGWYKSRFSTMKKLLKDGHKLQEVYDVLGLRVVLKPTIGR